MIPVERPDDIRQSLLAAFDRCPLSTRFSMETEQRQPSWLAARGTLGHRFFAEALQYMVANDERQIPVDVAMELLQEVIAQRGVPDDEVVHLPMSELKWLRVIATKFAYGHSYSVDKVISIERRLYADVPVRGPEGRDYVRTISGQLDVLLAEPPDGAIVVDYKTGWAPAPRKYDRDSDEAAEDRLSDMGYAQQVIYGFLVMANYPAVQRVTLREFYVLSDEVRESTIERWQMERIQDVLAAIVAQFDGAVDSEVALREAAFARAKAAGKHPPKTWKHSDRFFPIAGQHCGYCPRPRDCPIREEVGIPASYEEAQAVIREWIVAGEVRKDRLKMAKSWVDPHGPVEIDHAKGRLAAGWVTNKEGDGRSFRLYQPEDAAASPFDPLLAAAARERGALER